MKIETLDIRKNYFKNKVNFATYLINKFGKEGVEIIKVIKLIFLADVYSLRNHSMLFSEDEYVAMAKGPVASEITNILTQNEIWLEKKQIEYIQEFLYGDIKNSFSRIFSKKNADNDFLSVNGKKVLDKIFSEFGNETPNELIERSHQFNAWKKHKHNIDHFTPSVKMDMSDIFENDGYLKVSKETIENSKAVYAQ